MYDENTQIIIVDNETDKRNYFQRNNIYSINLKMNRNNSSWFWWT